MREGLKEFLGLGVRYFRNATASTFVGLRGPQAGDPATSFNITLPQALPAGSPEAMFISSSGVITTAAAGGGGSVTSVALSVPSILSVSGSPITSTGTLAVSLATQTANTVFAGAVSDGAATPAFRSLVYADISALAGVTSTTFAVGNDSRFHTRNADTGTTNVTFAVDSGGTGLLLKNNAGALQLRNLADNAFADIEVNNLLVRGTTTTINSETLTVDDNIIVLNNNVSSGTPTENGGIEVRRGASTSATVLWNESTDIWEAGLVGATAPVARTHRRTLVNGDLTAGTVAITHGLGQQYLDVTVVDNTGKKVIPDEITYTNSTSYSLDVTSFGAITGTWNILTVG